MKTIVILISFNILCYIDHSIGQDCIGYGKMCSDNGQCCGGCCIEGFCIHTYKPCYDLRNPCMDHYCPPLMDCHVFKPEGCSGCELQAICE